MLSNIHKRAERREGGREGRERGGREGIGQREQGAERKKEK
jgi:hypothetical protein